MGIVPKLIMLREANISATFQFGFFVHAGSEQALWAESRRGEEYGCGEQIHYWGRFPVAYGNPGATVRSLTGLAGLNWPLQIGRSGGIGISVDVPKLAQRALERAGFRVFRARSTQLKKAVLDQPARLRTQLPLSFRIDFLIRQVV